MAILEPGQDFGVYRLVSALSRGGMGEVWRALKLGPSGSDWSRQVALKIILPGLSDSARFTEMFVTEARIAAGLVHANIVNVSDFGREGGIFWLEQELVDGEDLARLLDRTPGGFPLPLALHVVIEAMKGLAYAHDHRLPDGRSQTVIHRDIKPANVLVAREGHVKLTDFGIAKALSGSNPSMTELKGTIGYIAPELLEGQAPTTRSDLFAMGLIFWELLCGKKLFAGDNEAAKLMKTFECVVPTLAEQGVWVPPQVEAILRRLLARSPAARYATGEAALAELLEAPAARQATSLDLKAYLATLGVSSLPAISASVATMPGKRWGTGTLAGQVSKSLPARLNRFFGRKSVLIPLFVLAAASVTAAFTVYPSRKTAPAKAAPPEAAAMPPAPAAAPAPTVPAPAAPTPPVVAATAPDAPPARGTVTIQVKPDDARVVVDGRTLGGGSPYVVTSDVGAALDLHVERSGFEPSDQRVHVEASEVSLPVELRPSAPAPVSRNNPKLRPKATGKEAPMSAKEPSGEPRRSETPTGPKAEPRKDDKELIFAPPEDN